MFISSMARKNKRLRSRKFDSNRRSTDSSLVNLDNRPLSRISIDSQVVIHGSKEMMRRKDSRYQSNSEKTIAKLNNNRHIPPTSHVTTASKIPHRNIEYLSDDEAETLCVREERDELPTFYSSWYLDPHYRHNDDVEVIGVTNDDHTPSLYSFQKAERDLIQTQIRAAAAVTPYEMDLYKLRCEKLKLEEAYLLKLKCDQELERTRGPKPKWYELKTKEFTTEMEKYSNMMQSKQDWQEIMEYRNKLFEISGKWGQQSY